LLSYNNDLLYEFALALYKTYKEVIIPFWVAEMSDEKLKFKSKIDTIPVSTTDKSK